MSRLKIGSAVPPCCEFRYSANSGHAWLMLIADSSAAPKETTHTPGRYTKGRKFISLKSSTEAICSRGRSVSSGKRRVKNEKENLKIRNVRTKKTAKRIPPRRNL